MPSNVLRFDESWDLPNATVDEVYDNAARRKGAAAISGGEEERRGERDKGTTPQFLSPDWTL